MVGAHVDIEAQLVDDVAQSFVLVVGTAIEVPSDKLKHWLLLEHHERQQASAIDKVAFDIDDAASLFKVKAWLIKAIEIAKGTSLHELSQSTI